MATLAEVAMRLARGRWGRLLGRLVSPLYAIGARADRMLGKGLRLRRGRPACGVVSVGGMTVGGAGKTPVTIWLARALARRGHRVVIASRGYKGRRDGAVTVVSDGRCVLSRYEEAGDEAMVLAARVPGVPVVVGTDRLRVGHDAVTLFDAEILVLDDGFQHHRLARDFDLVCLDSRAGLGNGRVLPAGPLREPLSALAQADALCWIGVMGDAPRVRSSMLESVWPAERPSFYGVRRALDLVPLGAGRAEAAHSLESLRGDRVGLLSGLARPAGLRALVEALGAEVVREERFPDHHAYRSQDLRFLSQPTPPERLCEGEQGDAEPVAASESPTRWITSEKDAYKIQPEWVGSARVDVLRIESAFEEEDSLIDLIEARLRERGRLV